MSTASHLEKLNGAQKKAVTHGEPLPPKGYKAGPLALLAGAGTGKTDTLAHRLAHLAIHGVDPGRVLLLTSTRRVATEMRHRAHDIVKKALNEPLGGVSHTISQRLTWIGTFHSIGNRLLRHYGRHLKLDPQFTVADRADAAELLDLVRMELGLAAKDQQFPRRETCLQIYSYRINTQKSLKDTLTQQFAWCLKWEEELTRLFRAYVERKQRCNILDQDDLLLYWHVMMSEPRLAQHVSAHFDHVLVDDYQDANKLQVEILHALKPDGAGVIVAGDDAQAIYPFRAAAAENICGFAARFNPAAETITLAQNYRSTQQVLDGSNALIAEAPRRERKHLLSLRGQGARPALIAVADAQAQAECVCSEVLRRREANIPLKRQAVLFRGLSQSEALEAELSRRKIPYVKYGGLKFLEAGHVKDLFAVLRWVDNPRNTVAAFRVLQLLPNMGPANTRKAIEHFEAQNHSFQSLQTFEPPQALGVAWKKLIELLLSLAEPQRQWPGQAHLAREWYKPHFERLYEHFHTRIGDLDQLELLSGQYPSRERFLTEVTLDPPNARGDEDHLTLSTIHAARGMEWDSVYVLNVADGSFPSEFAMSRPELMEEERRLLYVAMTRAQSDLLVLAPGKASRYMTDKVRRCFELRDFQGSSIAEGALRDAAQSTVDAGARLKEMW
jgi:DNA helicase II / ATP-dependent DNA helicase PcrA